MPDHELSPFMLGDPLRSSTAPDGATAAARIEAAILDGCTCKPVIHVYDAGDGATGMALLHDEQCERLLRLKAEND